MLIKILQPDFVFEDERGSLVQLAKDGYKQINVVRSKAGAKRGGHLHRRSDEAFYVAEGALRLSARNDDESETHEFREGDMFLIPKGVAHDFSFLSDTLLVSMYTSGVEREDGSKDIIPSPVVE